MASEDAGIPVSSLHLTHASATEVLSLIQSGSVTVEQYARSLLEQVKERDAEVKAWAYLDPERVILQARTLDQTPKDKRGPLHGIPVGIKDIMNTKGHADSLETNRIDLS